MAAPLENKLSGDDFVRACRARMVELDPNLSVHGPRYHAAMLLLALTSLPARIDHLAGALRIPREFVARSLRRLVDNGVLQHGALVCSWSWDLSLAEAFWADVNVALGVWWRRQGARGNLEWIEAGAWQKPFDYVSHPGTLASQTSYIAPASSRPQMNIDGLLLRGGSRGAAWIGSIAAKAEPEPPRWMAQDEVPALAASGSVSPSPAALLDRPAAMEGGVVWLG